MNNRDVAQEWFKVAEMDLASAEYLRNMRPVPAEIICYHSQQAAEKFLKLEVNENDVMEALKHARQVGDFVVQACL